MYLVTSFESRFGSRVERLRCRRGLSDRYVAAELGIPITDYQLVERGAKAVSVDLLAAICRLLGCSADALVFGIELD